MTTIPDIANEINARAIPHAIGHLQEIRQQLKRLKHLPTHKIFSSQTTFERWAFHVGGRTELQFNIGLEVLDAVTYLRHGVAFSLEPSRTLPDIAPLLPKVRRFNQFLRIYPDELADLRMWSHDRHGRSSIYSVGPISADLAQPKVFIFIGALGDAASPDYDRILFDFDRLLPLYRYVEGDADFPSLTNSQTFTFVPGCAVKPSQTTAVLTQRELDVQLRHNDLQLALYEHLVAKHGADAVAAEQGNGAGARVDVAVRIGSGYIFYEIKTALSARSCIREALAQLLEYSFWPGSVEAKSLRIVGEPPLDSEAAAFLKKLRNKFSLPVEYQQFDLVSRKLLS